MRALACPICLWNPAFAASEDAWAEFREDARSACRALLQETGPVPIEVNPFGTESYGIALITVKADRGGDRLAGVSGKAQLSASFSP